MIKELRNTLRSNALFNSQIALLTSPTTAATTKHANLKQRVKSANHTSGRSQFKQRELKGISSKRESRYNNLVLETAN